MKKKLFLLLLLFSSIASFAQKKINVFCRVALDGVILYPKNLGDFLPDSLRASVLLNPRKDYKIKTWIMCCCLWEPMAGKLQATTIAWTCTRWAGKLSSMNLPGKYIWKN